MTSQSEINANINKILDSSVGVYKDLQMKDMFGCVTKLMECAETIPTLKGADKKQVVVGVLGQLVHTIPFPNEKEAEMVMSFVNSGLVGLIIDGVVNLTKEGCKINIQEVEQKCSKCCKCKCCIM